MLRISIEKKLSFLSEHRRRATVRCCFRASVPPNVLRFAIELVHNHHHHRVRRWTDFDICASPTSSAREGATRTLAALAECPRPCRSKVLWWIWHSQSKQTPGTTRADESGSTMPCTGETEEDNKLKTIVNNTRMRLTFEALQVHSVW